MTKYFLQLLVAATLFFAAPVAQAYTLQDQRQDVFNALEVVADEIEADIMAAQAELAGLPPLSFQARLLRREILILSGRLRFIETTQRQVFYFNSAMLDRIILRYDLPVSLS